MFEMRNSYDKSIPPRLPLPPAPPAMESLLVGDRCSENVLHEYLVPSVPLGITAHGLGACESVTTLEKLRTGHQAMAAGW